MENEGRDTPFDVYPPPYVLPLSFSFVLLGFCSKTKGFWGGRRPPKTLTPGTVAVFPWVLLGFGAKTKQKHGKMRKNPGANGFG